MYRSCPGCLYPSSHPLGIFLSGERCSGCVTHEEKDTLYWGEREAQLNDVLRKHVKKSKTYDCVVPVVGDAEDFFTLQKVLEIGLRPLVVSVNDYFKNDIGWKNLDHLVTYFDVDSISYNPDVVVYKELVKTSLRKHDHMLLPFLQLHTAFPVHIAKERNISLIIWGQNQAVEQAGKFSHTDNVEMSRWSRREHDLFGVEVVDLIGNGAQVNPAHLNYYQYPKAVDIYRSGVVGLYLSNFYRWDPLAQNASTLSLGFYPEANNSSFDVYERAGSSVYYQIHDLLKYKRLGYRKINDHVAREIRHGRLSPAEGKDTAEVYSKRQVNIRPFFEWLGVSKSGFDWFKSHRLYGLQRFISDSSTIEPPPTLPLAVRKLVPNGNEVEDSFVILGKGVYI